MKNGERYKSVKECLKAFCEMCNRRGILMEVAVFEQWLDLEAEEEKPMPCPFCNRYVVVRTIRVTGNKKNHVVCDICGYRSKGKGLEAEAIAAHNRVCKAVAAYKENN